MAEFLKQRPCPEVTEDLAAELRRLRPEFGERALRRAWQASGVRLAPMVEGVRQTTFGELERTLVALELEYEAGGVARRREVRRFVIQAKQHAFLASRNPRVEATLRRDKQEMVLWLRTWLENPPLFPAWVVLRRKAAP